MWLGVEHPRAVHTLVPTRRSRTTMIRQLQANDPENENEKVMHGRRLAKKDKKNARAGPG